MPIIIRKHSGRILVLVTLLAATGIYGYYYGREWLAKWAFAHQTDFGADELILITIPQTSLTRATTYLLSEGEFAWQGEMIDVLHREIRSDTLFIYGFRDAAETDLKREAAWLYRNAAQPDPLPGPATKRTKWFSPFILPDGAKTAPLLESFMPDAQVLFCYSSPRNGLPVLEVPSPPPDWL